MNSILDSVRIVVIPALTLMGVALFLLVCHVLVLHGVRELDFRRRGRLLDLYRPAVAAALHNDHPEQSLRMLRAAPGRHLLVLAALVLEPLRTVNGTATERARALAAALGLLSKWETELNDRRWWIRAEAAHALGLTRHQGAVRLLVGALNDPSDEVRAAAVEALGCIADPVAIPELVARLGEQSRHQRVRLVEALQQFGSNAVSPLLEHAHAHSEDVAVVAEILGSLQAPSALPTLLDWCHAASAKCRASAVRAVGAIGLDQRAYYHVLRALTDEAADVRAAGAWALGRSGRPEAVAYLSARLGDEWMVAAQSARALALLGPSGRQVLERAATAEGSELARQVLWECAAGSQA
jgi:HEAT repeat protein